MNKRKDPSVAEAEKLMQKLGWQPPQKAVVYDKNRAEEAYKKTRADVAATRERPQIVGEAKQPGIGDDDGVRDWREQRKAQIADRDEQQTTYVRSYPTMLRFVSDRCRIGKNVFGRDAWFFNVQEWNDGGWVHCTLQITAAHFIDSLCMFPDLTRHYYVISKTGEGYHTRYQVSRYDDQDDGLDALEKLQAVRQ